MYNIVIFSGGTGSIALQKGLSHIYGSELLNIDIVINAFDNGKSTGECRKVFHNQILGPSDLRKNQITQFSIKYADELKDEASFYSQLFSLFTLRFSADSHQKYYERGREILLNIDFLGEDKKKYLITLLECFFFDDIDTGKFRENVKEINFEDFSLSNVFYAACAALNHNSLAYAGQKMAEILSIPDNVHLISHLPLFLGAKTKSGMVIDDEAIIVSWRNSHNPIQSVFLRDSSGREYVPGIDEGIGLGCRKVADMIEQADIIIFSSGTQWSSLIPTYLHKGFQEAVAKAKAAKYLIMNNTEDDDMLGVGSDEICNIISQYIDLSDIKIVINDNAADNLRKRCSQYQYIHTKLSDKGCKKHNPDKLVELIFNDFFKESLACSTHIYDLDGTLWNSRGDIREYEIGKANLRLFSGMIVSGNSYEHVRTILTKDYTEGKDIKVFCDYGNTFFNSSRPDDIKVMTTDYNLEMNIIEKLEMIEEFQNKIYIRGNVVITIKPLDNRLEALKKIREVLSEYNGRYIAKIAGHTSIDICRKEYNKAVMVDEIIHKYHLDRKKVLYIGNELSEGNDAEIRKLDICTLQVNDVYECNVFLKTLENVRCRDNGAGLCNES